MSEFTDAERALIMEGLERLHADPGRDVDGAVVQSIEVKIGHQKAHKRMPIPDLVRLQD